MNNKKITISIENVFIGSAAIVVIIFLAAILLAEFNLFAYVNVLWIFSILSIGLVGMTYLVIAKKIKVSLSRWDIIAIILTLSFCALNLFFFHEPFSGGRDDGVYANTGLYLAKFNSIYIKDVNVATFPGFINTSKGVISQFYLGYISWIAMIIRFFGVSAISFVNFPLLLIGLVSIYYICKNIEGWKTGILSIVLISISYPFLWFTRKTFSENLFFMLTWFGTLCLIKGFNNKNIKFFLLSILSLNLLSTVRVESIPLVLLMNPILIAAFFKQKIKKYLLVLFPIIILSLIPAIYYYAYLDPRYIGIFRSEISTVLTMISNKLNRVHSSTSSIINKNIIEYSQPQFVFVLLQLYNFYFFIFMIPIAVIKSFYFYSKKQRIHFILIILILLPNLFFLIKPEITFDQPWFLRRFMPVILPVGIISFCSVVSVLNKKIQVLVIAIILVGSFSISAPIFIFKEYSGAMEQTQKALQGHVSNNDILLVDYDRTGHYKLAEPLSSVFNYKTAAVERISLLKLFGKKVDNSNQLYSGQAFQINPKNICTYNNLYILTTGGDKNILTDIVANEKIIPIKDYEIKYDELINTCELFRITDKTTLEQMANVSYNSAKEYCNSIPNDIYTEDLNIRLEKIDTGTFNEMKNKTCQSKKNSI